MRVRHVLPGLYLLLLTQTAAATEEEALPALELLGFIADFSDENEGWVDPQELEELFSPGGEAASPEAGIDSSAETGYEDSTDAAGEGLSVGTEHGFAATKQPDTHSAAN